MTLKEIKIDLIAHLANAVHIIHHFFIIHNSEVTVIIMSPKHEGSKMDDQTRERGQRREQDK